MVDLDEPMRCDNCDNDVEVEFSEDCGRFHCMPCRGAWERGEESTYFLRPTVLLGRDPLPWKEGG